MAFLDGGGLQRLWSHISANMTRILERIVGAEENITALQNAVPFSFGIDENGNYGYVKEGADTVTPFDKGLKYVGDFLIERAVNTMDLTMYPSLEDSDIFLVPQSIIITKSRTATGSETATFIRSFENGILTVQREAFNGNITVSLPCKVYIYY